MNDDRPPVLVPATPESVLDSLRDSYRQSCCFDSGVERGVELTFETTISRWREVCDLVDWRQLGRSYNYEWNIQRPDKEWRAVLTPGRKRTLGDLCEFLSEHAMMPVIEPVTILGSTCRTAGAFLAIRSILKDSGADVDAIGPSTPLEPYTKSSLNVFLGPVSRLAPNALPELVFEKKWYDRTFSGFILFLLLALSGFAISPFLTIIGSITAAGFFLANAMIATWGLPSKADFGDLRTFRDMARRIAEAPRSVGNPG